MKKFKTNEDRLNNLKKRSQLIKESFHATFNKIKRIDEGFDSNTSGKFFNYILQGHEADENTAYEVAQGLDWQEIEATEGSFPYLQYIDTVNGVGIYHNYGSDDYYFTDESGVEENKWGGEDYSDGGYDPHDNPDLQGQEDFYDQMNQNESNEEEDSHY